MTAERWQRIQDLFDRALQLDANERESWLRRECPDDPDAAREVLELLSCDERSQDAIAGYIERGAAYFINSDSPDTIRMAGPYRLTRELGSGGMGTVYLGERADGQYQGEVAVKLIRPGMDTEFFLARFGRERQALARLRHPNIARLLDSGTTDEGMPYIVMERVEGIPINAYVRKHGLGVEEILRLFLDVARAVSHAHQCFVVHRDIKPGNIMVEAAGNPKLLDFGICKLIEDVQGADTLTGAQLMTPAYASPEQVRGETITVASDIYALGAVLYELITGRSPHAIDKTTPENIFRAICETPVPPPSRIAPSGLSKWKTDLDTILLKALQKEPERRYPSVEQFSEDLRRVLDHEPVLARPDTITYRTGKFVRRHRVAVATTALVMFALAFGIVAYARQVTIARKQASEARRLANLMMFDIHDQIRNLSGSLAARELLVKSGLQYLDQLSKEASNDAPFRRDLAAAYLRIGEIQGSALESNKGDTDGAMTSFSKALAAIEPVPDTIETGPLRMEILRRLALAKETRDSAAAVADIERSIAIGAELRQRNPNNKPVAMQLAQSYGSAGLIYRRTQNLSRVLEVVNAQREVLAAIVAAEPADRDARGELALAFTNAGTAYVTLGRLQDARLSFEQTVAAWEKLCAENPQNSAARRNLMLGYSHLGDVSGNPQFPNLKDPVAAQKAFDKMVRTAEELYAANPDSQRAIVDLGMALARASRLPREPLEVPAQLAQAERAVELLDKAVARDPANATTRLNTAIQREHVGDLYATQGNLALSSQRYEAAVRSLESAGTTQAQAAKTLVALLAKIGDQSARRGDSKTALAVARKAVAAGEKAAYEAKSPVFRVGRARAYEAMANVLRLLNQPAESQRWYADAQKAYLQLIAEEPANAVIKGDYERFLKARPAGLLAAK